jgi:DNA-binding transcriptional ArsR family regulator
METQQTLNYFEPFDTPRLISASKLMTLELRPGKQHWGRRIRSGQSGMIFAPRGSGKTFKCLALAIAMATGCKWLGLQAKAPRRVIYLDGEMDLPTVKKRIAEISVSLGTDVPKNLKVFSPEMFTDLLPSINTADGQKVIDNMIGEDFDVLFIDNYSAFNDSGSENAEAWAPVMRWLLRHKRAGRTIIMVHHTGKVGKKQRGTSKHEDAMDWVISLSPIPNGNHGSRDLKFTLEWQKIRHLAMADVPSITVTMHVAENGELSWSHENGKPEDPTDARILKLSKEGKNNTEIAEIVAKSRSAVSRKLKELNAS